MFLCTFYMSYILSFQRTTVNVTTKSLYHMMHFFAVQLPTITRRCKLCNSSIKVIRSTQCILLTRAIFLIAVKEVAAYQKKFFLKCIRAMFLGTLSDTNFPYVSLFFVALLQQANLVLPFRKKYRFMSKCVITINSPVCIRKMQIYCKLVVIIYTDKNA